MEKNVEAARKTLTDAGFTEWEFSAWANGWTLNTSDCPEQHVKDFLADMRTEAEVTRCWETIPGAATVEYRDAL